MAESGEPGGGIAAVGAAPTLRLGVVQFAPVPGDVATNATRIAAAAAGSDADLLVTPELALTGYDVGDDAAELALALDEVAGRIPGLGDLPALVLGFVERGRAGTPYNAAALLRRGRAVFRHRKLYLPTYGMFDEGRFFGRGRTVRPTEVGGWRVGVLICEDFWHPALSYLLATQGIELLLVLAAAPGRGAWEGAETGGGFASSDVWERIARTTAQLYGIYVALANRTGAENGVGFAGGSVVAGPSGEVVARADELAESVLAVRLDRRELERNRRPYSHARDDDPSLTLRELGRIVAAPASGRRARRDHGAATG